MEHARTALAEVNLAKTNANTAWTSAKDEAKGDEVKACADGYEDSRRMQNYLDTQVKNLKELLAESDALLALSANPSAGKAAEQAARLFHEAEVAWFDEKHKLQNGLVRESSEQFARHDQDVAAAEAAAAKREEGRQEKHTLRERQVRADELRAEELNSLSRRVEAERDEAERRARMQASIVADMAKPD
jgi:hypothetical protein